MGKKFPDDFDNRGTVKSADKILIWNSDTEVDEETSIGDILDASGNGKVAIDSEATAGYLGASSSDGVLRIGSSLSYIDGGDFITIDLDSTLKSNYDSAYSHISSDGSEHSFIDQSVVSGASPIFSNTNFSSSADKRYITDAQLVVIGNTSNTNTGDQTSLTGISDTKANFDTALSDGSFAFSGGAFHDGFSDFVANEHIDWTADQGATNIAAANIPDLSGIYQPLDADLTAIAGLSSDDSNFIVGSATGWVAESGATARTSLGGTTVGQAFFTLSNPSAIRFIRINADNSVSALSDSDFRTAIGAGTSSTVGTVTSVAAGNGMDFTTITGSGDVTMGTPSTLTSSTTNSVTGTTHTHAITGSTALLGNGTSQYQTIITGATPFAPVYSGFLLDGTTGGKTSFAVTNTKTLTLTSTGDFNMTITATGTAAMLNQANSFTLINPLTTIAESWIGPSSTTGIYFKDGLVGIGTTAPSEALHVVGNIKLGLANYLTINDSWYVSANGTSFMQFGKGSQSNSMYWNGSGLGLLISAPANTLDVKGNAVIGSTYAGTVAPTNGLLVEGNVGFGNTNPATKVDISGAITQRELSADPADPAEGSFVTWMSNGTATGDDGDIMIKITAGGVTKTTTLIDFSAL